MSDPIDMHASPHLTHPVKSDSIRLFFLGFLTLFLELALIRYLAGNIWNLGYFPNLVLLGVFVGMGTGFIFHQYFSPEKSSKLHLAAAYLLFLLSFFVTFFHPPIPGFMGSSGDMGGDLYFTIAPSRPQIVSQVMFVFWFLSVIVIFFAIAQSTAKVFQRLSPLRAYTLDIAGSCLGIISFMLISTLKLPAYLWFLAIIPTFLLGLPAVAPRKAWGAALSLLLVAGLSFYQDTRLLATYGGGAKYKGPVDVTWSPYQKIEYFNSSEQAHRVHVNGLGHQQMEPASVLRSTWYQVPYQMRQQARMKTPGLGPIQNVLLIGAGSGNDVATALMNGATHVDAVEIDPVIAQLGKEHHPEHPYQDPRVTLTVDDGRAFMVRAQTKYDLIIFALTDSLVKVSPMAQLRLENFLFTVESCRRASELLNPGGQLVLYNYYRKPWLVSKIEKMLFEATGQMPVRAFQQNDFVMFSASSEGALQAPLRSGEEETDVPHDDWPFLYLKQKGMPGIYQNATLGVLGFLFLLFAGFQFLTPPKSTDSQSLSRENAPLQIKIGFLLMGVAFMLLETKSIIQFSLLFGTTWINNSLVFLSVLISVLLANWAALAVRRSHLKWVYLLLIGSCLSSFFFPLGNLLSVENPAWRFFWASLMTFSPLFFANLIFSSLFRRQKFAEHVFGWNLLGATLGGVAEYFSMVTGYNALSIVIAVSYVLVFALFARSQKATQEEAPVPVAAV